MGTRKNIVERPFITSCGLSDWDFCLPETFGLWVQILSPLKFAKSSCFCQVFGFTVPRYPKNNCSLKWVYQSRESPSIICTKNWSISWLPKTWNQKRHHNSPTFPFDMYCFYLCSFSQNASSTTSTDYWQQPAWGSLLTSHRAWENNIGVTWGAWRMPKLRNFPLECFIRSMESRLL